MKKQFYCFLLTALCVGTMAFAKTTYPTMTENGKVYYLYTVQKSEGLYAISQRFGVPQAIILEANPGIKAEGLVLGQQIKVPKNATEKNTKTVQVGKNQHVVKAKETLYGLSKKYNCTVDELLELNPWATHLTIGAVLQIPEKSKTKAQESNEESLPQTTAQAQPQVTNQTTEAGSKETKTKESTRQTATKSFLF
ncbi:MAG: LysM peptidoglycan-binding domain-containing protein, partial [Paludibacteraceae bacterium]|nr:LysM peptidoglycan-binding domain-containing protein [Paludibacteraceae bacterium]